MDVFDAPVCLTRSAPLGVGSGQLIFYDVIDSDTVSRSGVLSCIAEAGGEVVLPNTIRLPDFRMWLTATTGNSTMLHVLSFASICIILKVADALDDAQIADWIDVAATRLTLHLTSNEQPHEDVTPQQIAQQLSLLPQSLLLRLFTAATRTSSQVQSLLDVLPVHLHQAIVAATVTPTRMLDVCLRNNSLPLVKALTTLSPAAPSILYLNVHCPEDSPMQGQAWQEAAPHLAKALQQHSGITSLRLDMQCIDANSAQMLAPAIITLRSLQSLHLHTSVDPSTPITLQQMLQALPQLKALSLSLHLVSEPSQSLNDTNTPSNFQLCLAAMLTPATSLTSLLIRAKADSGRERFVTTRPLHLPCLSQLIVLFHHPESPGSYSSTCRTDLEENTNCYSIAASALMCQLSAPLTSLEVRPGNRWLEDEKLSDDANHVFRLYGSLARFTQLRRLSMSAPVDAHFAFNIRAIDAANNSAAPPALAQLRQLRSLCFAATVATCLATVPLLMGATALSHLHMRFQFECNTPSLSPLFSALSFLPLLSLDMEIETDEAESPGIDSLLVRELTRLTALRVCRLRCLNTPTDIAALARMTGLQKLHLMYVDMLKGVHVSCVRALQALPALTSLLCAADGDSFFVDALVAEAPPQAWPALQELSLKCGYATTVAFRFESNVSALPQLGIERLTQFKYERDYHAELLSYIEGQAADAGIKVSFHDEISF